MLVRIKNFSSFYSCSFKLNFWLNFLLIDNHRPKESKLIYQSYCSYYHSKPYLIEFCVKAVFYYFYYILFEKNSIVWKLVLFSPEYRLCAWQNVISAAHFAIKRHYLWPFVFHFFLFSTVLSIKKAWEMKNRFKLEWIKYSLTIIWFDIQ